MAAISFSGGSPPSSCPVTFLLASRNSKYCSNPSFIGPGTLTRSNEYLATQWSTNSSTSGNGDGQVMYTDCMVGRRGVGARPGEGRGGVGGMNSERTGGCSADVDSGHETSFRRCSSAELLRPLWVRYRTAASKWSKTVPRRDRRLSHGRRSCHGGLTIFPSIEAHGNVIPPTCATAQTLVQEERGQATG